MPRSVPSVRVLIVPMTIAAVTLVFATPTLAQQARPGEHLGMRYLSWAGKPVTSAPEGAGDVTPRQQPAALQPSASAASPGRPSRYGAPAAYGLTPASAWIGRPAAPVAPARDVRPHDAPATALPVQRQAQAAMPAATPSQTSAPSLDPATASAPAYDAGRSFRRQDPYYAAPPQVQMAMQPAPQPTYAVPPPVRVPTAAEPAATAAYDPMAPRPDAPIFRMGRPAAPEADASSPQPDQLAPQSAPQTDQNAPRRLAQAVPTQAGDPPREGARYYSVHREAGHEPDPLTLPESVFIGGGATADLAEPPPVPVTTRTVSGRAQVIVPNQDPTLP